MVLSKEKSSAVYLIGIGVCIVKKKKKKVNILISVLAPAIHCPSQFLNFSFQVDVSQLT